MEYDPPGTDVTPPARPKSLGLRRLALFYTTVQTVFGVWLFMMPLLDMGIAGLKSPMGMMAPVGSLLRHWGYGLVLAFLVPAPGEAPSPTPERAGL